MKKLLLILLLVIAMSLTFTTPAFADDEKGNMPGKATALGIWRGLNSAIRHIALGWANGSGTPVGWGIDVSVNHAIGNIMDGDAPGQSWW